jgi:hypothetical protein
LPFDIGKIALEKHGIPRLGLITLIDDNVVGRTSVLPFFLWVVLQLVGVGALLQRKSHAFKIGNTSFNTLHFCSKIVLKAT